MQNKDKHQRLTPNQSPKV